MPYYTDPGSVFAAYPAINSAQVKSGLSSAVVLGFIDQVEAEVNAKVSNRYALPMTVVCPLVAAIALRETIYRICLQRALVQFPPATQGKAPLAVQHEQDQKMLDAIAEGEMNLVDSSLAVIGPISTGRGQIFSTTMNQNPTFTELGRTSQVQDTDKLDALEAERIGRGL